MRLPECEIRPAQETDGDGLFPLVAEFATSFVPERKSFDQAFSSLLGEDHACVLVAERNGRLVGYLLGFDHPTFFANGPASWVEEIAVHSSLRRNGIGRALMTGFEEWAISRGSRLVALATRRAARFYAALGYEESATYFRKVL